MPTVTTRPIEPGSCALIVGNGPSGLSRKWPLVWRWVGRQRGALPDVCLINWSALGPTTPRYAVACDTDVLRTFRDSGLQNRTIIVCNSVENTCGPDSAPERLDDLFPAESCILGRNEWPPLASGPLAAWMMTALGYETILLYALDGTARPFDGDHSQEMGRRAKTWERLICRHLEARADGDGKPKLVRVWPKSDIPNLVQSGADPLASAIDGTILAP